MSIDMTKPIVIGDIREELSNDLRRVLETVINRYQHKRNPYYVLVYSETGLDVFPADSGLVKPGDKVMAVDGKTVIRTKVLILDAEPSLDDFMDKAMKGKIKVMGMMCYKVDNIRGQLLRLWVLPQDIPEIDRVVDEDGIVREVLDGAQMIGKFIH